VSRARGADCRVLFVAGGECRMWNADPDMEIGLQSSWEEDF
jgi:hypothetical protein